MRNIIGAAALGLMIAVSASAQFVGGVGQCDRTTLSPIQCGYFEEGYQDGMRDAQSNQTNDYRRYRAKLDGSKYEANYRQGYDSGYSAVRPYSRWNREQRDSYDSGYRAGESDRRRNISRLAERYDGQYNRTYEAYFKQGYYDGFDNRARTYDTPIGVATVPTYPTNPVNPNNPNFPTFPGGQQGTPTGNVSWSGRVDDRVNVIIRGAEVRSEDVTATGFFPRNQTMTGVLPRRPSTVSVRKIDGRGTASVIQQPTRANGFTAIVQVFDPKGGTDDYRLDISWQAGAQVDEPYQSGRATWRGRVDQNVNIIISGSEIQAQDIAGTGLTTQRQNMSGYLARRPGTVSVRKEKGRGTVNVIQQPSAENDYIAVIQIFDADRGDSEYEIEISW
jgi:hypothetical protein